MPRPCSVCTHDESHAVNVELVARTPYRTIADRYSLSQTALKRHSQEHIPKLLVEARRAVEQADADDLLGEVKGLHERTMAILEAAEKTEELRTALGAIREARGNVELLARLRQILDTRPVVNLHLSPEWLELRAVIVTALEGHEEARESVLKALEAAGNGRGWDGS